MDDRAFVKHAAVYGMANLLVQAGGFVLLPLYTRFLTKADFGALEVVGRIAETVGTCLLIGGLRQALVTFYQQSEDAAVRRRFISSAFLLLAFTCLLGGGVALALAEPLCSWLQAQGHAISRDLVRLAVLAILLEPLTLIPLALIQARMESVTFVLITVGQFLVRVGLSIVLVAWLGWGALGALLATSLTAAAVGTGLCARELVRGAAWPDRTQVMALLRFALPFLPGGLCFFMLHHGDRFFLLHYRGEEEVGTYALGYKLALAVSMFSLTPLYMVWSVPMYEVARAPDAPAVFGRAFTRILAIYLLVGLGLCLFQDEVVAVLGGDRYRGAVHVIAPVLLACFFQSSASLMDAGFYVRHRTGLKLWITLLATAVMLVLYVLLIPPYGGMGAALATLGGFAILAASTWLVTQRIFPIHYEWWRLVPLLALAAVLWLTSRLLPVAWWAVVIKAALWLLWPTLLWRCRLVSPAEKRYVLALACQGLSRWRRAIPAEAPPARAARPALRPRPAARAG
jgi:O-antigen/teichoic acid export membrane protein